MATTGVYGEPIKKASPECPHCSRGWILDQVETTLGEYEDVSYLCHMCAGTGRKTTKSKWEAIKAGNPGRGRS